MLIRNHINIFVIDVIEKEEITEQIIVKIVVQNYQHLTLTLSISVIFVGNGYMVLSRVSYE